MTKRLTENQLGLYFSVGPTGEASESLCSQRHTKSHAALEKLFSARGMALFGVSDVTVSDDYRFLPMELCEVDWEGAEVEGRVVYSVWFHSTTPFDVDTARKLRELAQQAYTEVCAGDEAFVRAELYQKWEETERHPFEI